MISWLVYPTIAIRPVVGMENFQLADTRRFDAALRRFTEENSRDPNTVDIQDVKRPRELVYAEWLTNWVLRLCPQASKDVRPATHCHHLRPSMVHPDSYPMT